MDLGPEEKSFKFWEVSRNRALKRFAQFFVQPAANGLRCANNPGNKGIWCPYKTLKCKKAVKHNRFSDTVSHKNYFTVHGLHRDYPPAMELTFKAFELKSFFISWNLLNGHLLFIGRASDQDIYAISCRNSHIATGCREGVIRLWSWTGQQLKVNFVRKN